MHERPAHAVARRRTQRNNRKSKSPKKSDVELELELELELERSSGMADNESLVAVDREIGKEPPVPAPEAALPPPVPAPEAAPPPPPGGVATTEPLAGVAVDRESGEEPPAPAPEVAPHPPVPAPEAAPPPPPGGVATTDALAGVAMDREGGEEAPAPAPEAAPPPPPVALATAAHDAAAPEAAADSLPASEEAASSGDGPRKRSKSGELSENDDEAPQRKQRRRDDEYDRGIGFPRHRPSATPFMHGWFLETHERVFRAVLTDETRVVLELGSWYGASTRWLARHVPPGSTVYAVDLWRDNFILDEQRDHYSTMGDRRLVSMLQRHPLRQTFLANLWDWRDRVVPLKMTTERGVKHLVDRGIVPDVIYIDADHHYEACKLDIQMCLDAFPDAILVGDDWGNYDDVKNAVTEMARKYGKSVHVDQNHTWTYARLESATGRTFTPRPEKKSSFASLLADFKA
ncbi:hypothetical protein M885DRAFT_278670 [Pelagophyceae sp. CCMP2097]|nr:hypothetical protein M885DRAFT_278670 [Pelagophyceae sp. CCMP2097]